MKINFKRLPLTKKPFLLICFFACMLVFASFNKEDRQKIREFKIELISKLKKDKNFDLLNNKSEEFFSINSTIKKNISESKNKLSSGKGTSVSAISGKILPHAISYPSNEKEGIIGVFSEKEEDRVSDNFFTINIPSIEEENNIAYLEYELFGLASHQSVSRSINHNISIGGEVIVGNAQWSHQKEKIDIGLLKDGVNTILFTSPEAGVKYKIKNLKIIFEKQRRSDKININSLISGDKLYIKGNTANSGSLLINDEMIPVYNGEFERIIHLSENDRQKETFSVTTNGITNIYKFPAVTKSFKILSNNYFSSKKITISNDQEFNIQYEDLNVKIEKETSESAYIEVLKLREKDIPAVAGGLKNVTLNSSGYRFSLKSGKLKKKIKITIPYDEKKLGLISPKEINVFSFDYNTKQWKIIESKEVDQKNKTITFEGDGDGDYINGIISLPESPQLNSFAPTTISGLKAANPVGAPLMQPPNASQTGDANINYPLILPAGVSGMQPSLSVTYSSDSGNGWMGEGWNIGGLSSISIDTKWGTPTFTAGQETELYSIDGEMLIYPDGYLPHRHNKVNPDGTFDTSRQVRNGSGSKTFYLRRNHDFTKIERFGNNPSDYRWIVTSTDGTKTYYGGDESTLVTNAVLKNYNGNIIQWGIWKVEDVHGNNIIYEYKNQSINNFTGDDQNLNAGWIFHIEKIFYSGRNGQKGPYSITFFNDTPRPDKQINTKGVLKRIEPYLLTKINIEFKNTSNQQLIVRSYNFTYNTGIFQKSLLSNMKMKVNNPLTDGAAFDYNFEYYDNGTVFGSPTNIATPNTDAFSDVVSSITTPSKISADNNFEWGWSLRTGGGFALLRPQLGGIKNFMISLFGGASYPRIKRGQELIDFNGDGIADILYRKRNGDNGIKLIPGSIDSNGQLVFNSAYQSVGNLNSNFSHSKGTTWNLGGSVVFNWFKMGFEFSYINSESENETPIYMMDANSDGLPDVIKDDKVWFNRRNGNAQEMVITSDLTENMVITDNNPQPYTEPEEPDDIDPVKPKNDVVKVWIAPKNGYIEISDEIAIASGQDNNAKAVYSIEIKNPNDASKNCRLYLKELINTASQNISIRQYNSYPGTPLGVSNSSRIYVKSGEKVYFRLHKKSGTNYIVNTNPLIKYTDNNGSILPDEFIEEQDGYMPNQTNYNEKFLLNNLTKSFKFTEPANIHITIPQFTIPALSDNVKYSIVLIKEDTSVAQNQQTTINVIYEETVGPSSGQPVVVSPVDINYSVPPLNAPDEAWHLKFLVETDSHINKEIEWKDIVVEGYPSASHKHYAVAQYPSYHIRNLKTKFDISTLNNLPSGNDKYSISINKNFNFNPSVSGRFMYVIKQKGIFLDKRIVEISNGTLKEYTIDYNLISGTEPIPFYDGDPTANIIDDQEKLNILIFCNTNKDRLAYEALKLQLNNNIFNIYNQSGSSLLNHTTETSINTGEYNGVSAIYHNWGQFLYNEARDIVPAAGSTNQQPPLIPGCEPRKENDCIAVPTGPSGSTGPAYTTNPNTPKDQYGALINDQTLENPFQFNLNFSACAGITNAQQYGECVGDQLANDFQNNYANNQVFGAASPFTPLTPYKADRGRVYKWVNQMFYEQYSAIGSFRDDETPTSPFIDDDPDSADIEVANNPNTRMFAISKKQKSKSKTKNAGIGFGLTFTNSTSQLRDIGNIQTQDFFDVNGDNYPDMLYRGQSQQTSILGGLKSAQSGIEGGYKVITRTDDFMNSKSIAFGPSGSKSVGRKTNNSDSNATGDTSVSWSMNVGVSNYPNSYNKTTEYWMDINGDGLPDKIEGNNYKLNFGTGLVNGGIPGSTGTYAGFEEPVSKPVYSASFGIGAGISSIVDVVQGAELGIAVSGGVGGGSSTATSKRSFLDVNGDGLVDIVQVNENTGQTNVKYNLGNRFASPVSLNASLAEETKTHSGYANLNGGYYINIPFIVIFGIPLVYLKPFGADLSANVGLSVSEINKGLRDVNGDGLPDLVVNTNDGLKIFYSQIGKTNKLKKVSYAESYSADQPKNLGAAFTINYAFSKPSYNDPQSKLVMSEVVIPNPDAFSGTYTLSTTGKDRITRFEYENSRYDRREREKYGFAKVKTYEMSDNNTVYRITVQNFYNQNYFIRGLLKSVENYGGTGTSNLLSSVVNTYKLYQFNPGISQLVEVPAAQFESYDVGGTEGKKMGRVLMSGTTKTNYESGNSISIKTTLFYNNRGQLTKYQYTSPSTSYNSVIAYHTNLNNNIQNIPSMITVYPGTGAVNPLRKRSTEITNLNTGDISKFKVWLTGADTAETDITYDPFGNIKTIKYPPNEFDQRSELEYFYDPMGKYVTQVKDPIFNLSSYATYNPLMDTVLEYTDVTGNKMKYNYDGYGRPLSVISPNDLPSTNTILYEYSHTPVTLSNGNTLYLFTAKTIHQDPYNNNDIETISFADVTGDVIQVKKDIEIDNEEKMSVSGRVINDNLGRAVMQYHPVFENKDALINDKLTLSLSQYTTSAVYDYKDRTLSSTDEAGNSVNNNFFIESNRFRTETTQMQNASAEIKTEVFADAEGKTVETRNHLPWQSVNTHFNYNEIGEIMRVVDPEGLETSFTYDMGGRRLSQNHPDRGQTTYTYSKAGQLTHIRNNNLNSNGGVPIHYVYSYNRLMNIVLPDIPSGPNPANVTYTYGASGNSAGRIVEKQDGTGTSYYEYGKMGELINEDRFIYGFYMPSLHFSSSYQYDNWNRIRTITYPDNEVVHYQYDFGGNLKYMANEEGYEYIKSIQYDHYEQRTKIIFGNDTSSTFTYEPDMRRLKNHLLHNAASNPLLNGTYSYDYTGNITGIANTSPTTNAGFGGNYAFEYQYDTLNRLTGSSGNAVPNRKEDMPPTPIAGNITSLYQTDLTYNMSSGIERKRQHHEQDGVVNPNNSFDNTYSYINGTHMVQRVTESGGTEETFEYDGNGNVTNHQTIQTGATNFYWDEQDRLRAVYTKETGSFQYYVYDDKGERTIKANLQNGSELYQNGEMIDNGLVFDGFKVYPNPYAVYSSDGMLTKHYFAGDQRIASRLSDSGGMFYSKPAASQTGKEDADPHSIAENDFKNYLSKAGYRTYDIEKEFGKAPAPMGGLYYLHGDHLGTATYVTNEYAEPTQFFLNLPFGETMVEQQEPTAYVNPYKFNAKELDSETGLYYYGARYYNPRLSIWYGVDPLAVYNPVMETQFYGDGQHNDGVFYWGNLNPYIYCYQNPIIYVDPNGKQTKVVKEGVLMNENFTTLRYKENMLPDYKNTYNSRQWIYVAALKQKSENNTTHLYGHGNHYGERSALMMYDKRKEPGNKYSGKFNTKGLRDLLNFENINTDFIDKKGGNIILHGCYSGAGDGSVAHTMSIEMPDKLIVGATEYVNYNKNGEIGTYDAAGKKGEWRVYKNGKVIKKYDWNWKPNAKDLNKIKK
ncbi:RHS repeat-associated protein [Chryseobacterium sp. SLBN-27]|uniref:SpvB/TcaC N-terminal domain-containing protein n=1 Tax=Chryseobacterium sp. SLBN-27 TaxID=3042287 RepID=UPI0028590626|nr:SpvB/TcaC N-terminal domain-containing protein [Chryseobacterium sp. SLBN-27]MDR6157658.1 RHS repeat-associated protein [Chryseobacterium sp. SLBN-27]